MSKRVFGAIVAALHGAAVMAAASSAEQPAGYVFAPELGSGDNVSGRTLLL